MATSIDILSAARQKQFDAPPRFTQDERQMFFEYSDSVRKHIRNLRSPANKVSFIIQYGYFKAKGRFFEPSQFHLKDINYIHRIFALKKPIDDLQKADLTKLYGGANSTRHRKNILELERWSVCEDGNHAALVEHAEWQTQKQAPPEEMLYALVSFCWSKHIVIPSYSVLSAIISRCYQVFEEAALAKIDAQITNVNRDELDGLLQPSSNNISLVAQAKRIEQSTRAQGMKKNAESLKTFSTYYFDNEKLINDLGLTDQATDYYADWIMKAKTTQIKQINNNTKLALYLLAFIKTQFYKRQDAALKGFLVCVRACLNKAAKKAKEYEKKTIKSKNNAIDAVVDSQKKLTIFAGEIIQIMDDPLLSEIRKNEIVRNRAISMISDQDDEFTEKLDFLDKLRDKEKLDEVKIDALEEGSLSLQKKLSATVKLLVFDEEYSDKALFKAIQFYQEKDGNIGQNPPMQFLTKPERRVVYKNDALRTSLYKVYLFRHMFDAIKSGKLSLKYSYEYRALQRYLLDASEWENDKKAILESAGLLKYQHATQYLDTLKEKLEATYIAVNERFSAGHNGYLKMNPNGRFRVSTPAIDYEKSKYITTLLSSEGEIPVLQVLREVDRDCAFTSLLPHHSNRNVVKSVETSIALAGLMGLGCNIGTRKMANMTVGNTITEEKLLDCVNWRFSIPNLNKINKKIVQAIESLDLPNIYKIEDNCIHSSSDGKKITVAVDSLLANYSYKYYGREKGVAVYSFIDDKQSLFHPTVISSTDREAIYVVDGLLHNSTAIHHIHSTDTHGYTEAIFGATHLIDVAFAPRFKNLEDQVIYSFSAKTTYQKQGYWILPSRQINRKLIEDNWDDILRFMATIKLGKTSASQLFKRLNSYAKDHPLYQALKEFGRIIKSQHILTVYDDLEFRQRIQKQLNRVELSNKFMDAVFWAREKQFQVGSKEEQEKYNLCKTIIQNAIIYWNYLFLSDRLLSTGNKQDRADMVDSIKKGSVLAWKHINFTGEYDFNKPAAKDYQFNIPKLKKLKLENILN